MVSRKLGGRRSVSFFTYSIPVRRSTDKGNGVEPKKKKGKVSNIVYNGLSSALAKSVGKEIVSYCVVDVLRFRSRCNCSESAAPSHSSCTAFQPERSEKLTKKTRLRAGYHRWALAVKLPRSTKRDNAASFG